MDAVDVEADVTEEEKAPAKSSPQMEHAWNWFKYHAEQRLKIFQFYMTSAAVIITGYGAAMENDRYFGAVMLTVVGVVVSVAFFRMDRRVSQLIKFGEAAMRREELVMETRCGYPEIRIVEQTETVESKSHGTYSASFRLIFAIMGCLFVLSCFYTIYEMAKVHHGSPEAAHVK